MRLSDSGRRLCAVRWALARALLACVSSIVAVCCIGAWASPGPTVQDVVEFTRVVLPPQQSGDALDQFISPDGSRAVVITRKADVATDAACYELLMLDLRDDARSAARSTALTAATLRAPQPLLRIVGFRDNNYAQPYVQDLRWHDAHTLLFRARLHDAPFQAYALRVDTRQLTPLTASTHGVVSFAVSRDLSRVVYAAPYPNPAMAAGEGSVVVGSQSFWSVKHGQNDLRAQSRMYRYFAAAVGSRAAAQPLGKPFAENGWWPPVSISPDGRWAVLHRMEPERQQAWSQQYPLVADAAARIGPGRGFDPLRYFTGSAFWAPRRLIAFRLEDGHEQAVVDAPDDALAGYTQTRSDRLWQGAGESIVIAGTHLPLQGQGGEAQSRASHVIEYWPDSGRWTVIAALDGRLEAAHALKSEDGFVVIDGARRRKFLRDGSGAWREASPAASDEGAERWHLEVGQALNVPPDLFAVGPAGRRVQLTQLNPQFSAKDWGSMRPHVWKDARGRAWQGGLMLPANHDPRLRYPLVIQTYGFSPTNFYLDGANVSSGYTSGFAGRAFMRENMVVLAMPVGPASGKRGTDRGLILDFYEGVRGAIESLAERGLVDRDRVGIIGWSMTGEHVLNLLTFSGVPIRAASILDGDANTLFSMTVTYGRSDAAQARKDRANGGGPYGATLANWVRNDPALHTDCIRAALRIETYGPAVLNNWDIYALMRRQYKPAEMVVVADGSHALARPSDRMVSLQGNVDWMRYWLKGEQRSELRIPGETAALLQAQYQRWDQMADLQRADEARPACPAQTAE